MQFLSTVIVVSLFVAALVGKWWFSADQVTLRAMKAVPRLPAGDVPERAKVRVVGTAKLTELLSAPLSGRPCAAWRVLIREKRGKDENSHRVTVVDEQKSVDFFLLDGGAKVRVSADHALVVLGKDWKNTTGMLRRASPDLEAFLRERGLTSEGFTYRKSTFDKTMQYREGVLAEGRWSAWSAWAAGSAIPTRAPGRAVVIARSPLLAGW